MQLVSAGIAFDSVLEDHLQPLPEASEVSTSRLSSRLCAPSAALASFICMRLVGPWTLILADFMIGCTACTQVQQFGSVISSSFEPASS